MASTVQDIQFRPPLPTELGFMRLSGFMVSATKRGLTFHPTSLEDPIDAFVKTVDGQRPILLNYRDQNNIGISKQSIGYLSGSVLSSGSNTRVTVEDLTAMIYILRENKKKFDSKIINSYISSLDNYLRTCLEELNQRFQTIKLFFTRFVYDYNEVILGQEINRPTQEEFKSFFAAFKDSQFKDSIRYQANKINKYFNTAQSREEPFLWDFNITASILKFIEFCEKKFNSLFDQHSKIKFKTEFKKLVQNL